MGDEQLTLQEDERTYAEAAAREYLQLERNWLGLHHRILLGVFLTTFVVEFSLGIFIIHSDMLTTSLTNYFVKFFIVPSGLNLLLTASATWVVKRPDISQLRKIYTVSLDFVGIGFVLFTVHISFSAIYFVFAIAIMLTLVYGNYRITDVTALLSIASVIVSELFIHWDADKVTVFESAERMVNFLISVAALAVFSAICNVVIRFGREKTLVGVQREVERQHLRKSILIDEMTGLYNRRAYDRHFPGITEASRLAARPLAMAVLDIDDFKQINDLHGHAVGDRVLLALANVLKEGGPEGSYTFRIGGEEFVLLLPNASVCDAVRICEGLLDAARAVRLPELNGAGFTCSCGVAGMPGDAADAPALFEAADAALYLAKKNGKNKVATS